MYITYIQDIYVCVCLYLIYISMIRVRHDLATEQQQYISNQSANASWFHFWCYHLSVLLSALVLLQQILYQLRLNLTMNKLFTKVLFSWTKIVQIIKEYLMPQINNGIWM